MRVDGSHGSVPSWMAAYAIMSTSLTHRGDDGRVPDRCMRGRGVCTNSGEHSAGRTRMHRPYVAENEAERARLKAVVVRLTDAGLARPMSEEWTVGVGLMHLAFRDGLSLAWERTGEVQIPPMRDMVEGMNQAMLPWWRTIAPAQVRHAVVPAAEAVDRKAETLPTPIIEAILAVRPRSLTRAVHRRQHLDQIERALAG
jgi:hypothetical protein